MGKIIKGGVEHNFGGGSSMQNASDVQYDNTTSGLTAPSSGRFRGSIKLS